MASYSVTPDDALAGTEELIPSGGDELRPGVLFYVTQKEFDTFSREIEALGDVVPTRSCARKVSEFGHLMVIDFLLSRVLKSPHFDKRDLELLGR
jgi:hypothetical protein